MSNHLVKLPACLSKWLCIEISCYRIRAVRKVAKRISTRAAAIISSCFALLSYILPISWHVNTYDLQFVNPLLRKRPHNLAGRDQTPPSRRDRYNTYSHAGWNPQLPRIKWWYWLCLCPSVMNSWSTYTLANQIHWWTVKRQVPHGLRDASLPSSANHTCSFLGSLTPSSHAPHMDRLSQKHQSLQMDRSRVEHIIDTRGQAESENISSLFVCWWRWLGV
jgi:hypothetical protein